MPVLNSLQIKLFGLIWHSSLYLWLSDGYWSRSFFEKGYFHLFHCLCLFADSGKRFGNQLRRSWQGPEHDGLLGSGSFPRPSGYTPGLAALKFRANDNYQLNRSNEPYHPPRPYKVSCSCYISYTCMLATLQYWIIDCFQQFLTLNYDFHLMWWSHG